MSHEHVEDYDRETEEFIHPVVTKNGVSVTANVELAIVPDNGTDGHPYAWVPAEVVDGKLAYFIQDMAPGIYRIKARATDTPARPVVDCGVFRII